MNDAGHAWFEPTHKRGGKDEPGELRHMLGTVDVKTGELKPMSSRNVYAIKKRLAEAGLLADASGGETCVWVSHDVAKRATRGKALCPYHRHYRPGYSSRAERPEAA